jgi:hypothetical protein
MPFPAGYTHPVAVVRQIAAASDSNRVADFAFMTFLNG